MSKLVTTPSGRINVSVGNFILLCRDNRQWNIHRVAEIIHRSHLRGPQGTISGTGVDPDSWVMINDSTYSCPHRPRNDKLFLQRVDVSRGFGARSDDETIIREENVQGVIQGRERAEGVAEAMANAQIAYDMTAKEAHDMFMFTMAMVRTG